MKKAQITFYIILGMIILMAFAFLLYLYTSTQDSIQKETTSIQKTQLNSFSTKRYAQTCIEDSFGDALSVLLSQGGYIYSDQQGSILGCTAETCTDLNALFYDGKQISYNEIMNSVDIKEINQLSQSPNYPCVKEDVNCKFLFDINRPCSYDESQKCPIPLNPLLMNSFMTNIVGDQSWTTQIENYVNFKTNECLKFDESEWLPYEVNKGIISSQLILGANDVNLKVKVPLEISSKQQTSQKEFFSQDHDLNYPVRLKSLYEFIKALIYADSSNPNFRIDEDYINLPQYLQGLNVQVLRSVKNNEDIVVVSDAKSILNSNSISYKFARHNIPPVLNYFSINPSNNYDIEIQWNQDLILNPEAFDANEDNIIYTYSGWASDRFMSSSLYESSQKEAKTFLDILDVGEHEVTIKVSDGEKEDWQVLRIHITG